MLTESGQLSTTRAFGGLVPMMVMLGTNAVNKTQQYIAQTNSMILALLLSEQLTLGVDTLVDFLSETAVVNFYPSKRTTAKSTATLPRYVLEHKSRPVLISQKNMTHVDTHGLVLLITHTTCHASVSSCTVIRCCQHLCT